MEFTNAINQPGTVMVEFYATWCPHCRYMMPIVEQVKELLQGKVKIYQFDIDKYPSSANRADVEATPTFIIYRAGREMWRHAGEINGELLLAKIESFI